MGNRERGGAEFQVSSHQRPLAEGAEHFKTGTSPGKGIAQTCPLSKTSYCKAK